MMKRDTKFDSKVERDRRRFARLDRYRLKQLKEIEARIARLY
ncbi:MAG: hypothetical protein WA958_00980 [Tunicatimonas sp.]